MEVALRLLQLLADPGEVLERADRPGGLGAAHLNSVLHNTVFKVWGAILRCLQRHGALR